MKQADFYLDNKKICTISIADTFWLRFKGLMGKTPEEINRLGGLLIRPCSQIHTFFMKSEIDVVYFDKYGNIVWLDESVPKSKCCKRVKGAKYLIEFQSGSIRSMGIKDNSKVEVIKNGR